MKRKIPESEPPGPEKDTFTAYNIGISVTRHRRMKAILRAYTLCAL